MRLEIVTPSHSILQVDAEEVYAFGPKGEIGILPGHAHYVTPLETGRLYYVHQGKRHSFVIVGGYLEVFGETIRVATDDIDLEKNIDLEESKKNLADLEKRLGQDSFEPEEFDRLVQQRDREQARVLVAS